MTFPRAIIIFLGLWMLASCRQNQEPMSEPPETDEEPVITDGYEVIAEKLNIPWSIAHDGEAFYISERIGSIVIVENGKIKREKVQFKEDLSSVSEAGFLGFQFHPEDPTLAVAYYTYEGEDGRYNRVVELVRNEEGWEEGRTLIDWIRSGNIHHGGRIKIGPDNKLYITTGDGGNPESAQDLSSLNGKILRMNMDGAIPEDNPFPDSFVYSYGHRNPQGLTWDSSGNMYSSEHGQSAHDEINLIEPGANYGWPLIQGDETGSEMKTPLVHSGDATWAPSGMVYHDGTLYAAQLRGQGVLAVDPDTGAKEQIISGFGRIRDVYIMDGYLYFITNNTDGRGNPGPDDDQLIRWPLDAGFE